MTRSLLLLALVAGCSEAPHEPVRVIAIERPAPVIAASAVVAPEPTPTAKKQNAKPMMPRDEDIAAKQPGFMTRAQLPPPVGQGEPNGNDAFRAAVEARMAGQ